MNSDEEQEVFSRRPKLAKSPTRVGIVTRSAADRLKSLGDLVKPGTSTPNTQHEKAKPTLPLTANTTQIISRHKRNQSKDLATDFEAKTPQTNQLVKETRDTQRENTPKTPTPREAETKQNIASNREKEDEQKIKQKVDTLGTKPKITMNQKEIQKNITTFVPEFSGQSTPNRENELARFLGTADSINDMLTTEEERQIFNRLIKFRLTGDAYIRIINKDVKTYKALRTILEHMYKKTVSLEELEQNLISIRQNYGETLRNYGYRLIEALDKYKKGYRSKYNLENIDEVYEKHLNETAVLTFKRGINSILLRDKIAMIKAITIDDIIKEAELTEKMLRLANEAQNFTSPQEYTQQNYNQPPQYTQSKMVICNYCQKANHTWDVCRSRLYKESLTQKTTPYTRNSQTNRSYANQQNNPYSTQRTYTGANGTQPQRNVINQNNYGRHLPAQYQLPSPQYNQPNRQVNYNNQFQPKYCSHCKTTKGHTYEECRNKFRQNGIQQPIGYTTSQNDMVHQASAPIPTPNFSRNMTFNNSTKPQPPDTSNLEQLFNNMKINTITPQQQQYYENHHTTQGNDNGSSPS